jgi:hypothetical protein
MRPFEAEWGLHPNQGDPAAVPELEYPSEEICKLSNTSVADLKVGRCWLTPG